MLRRAEFVFYIAWSAWIVVFYSVRFRFIMIFFKNLLRFIHSFFAKYIQIAYFTRLFVLSLFVFLEQKIIFELWFVGLLSVDLSLFTKVLARICTLIGYWYETWSKVPKRGVQMILRKPLSSWLCDERLAKKVYMRFEKILTPTWPLNMLTDIHQRFLSDIDALIINHPNVRFEASEDDQKVEDTP